MLLEEMAKNKLKEVMGKYVTITDNMIKEANQYLAEHVFFEGFLESGEVTVDEYLGALQDYVYDEYFECEMCGDWCKRSDMEIVEDCGRSYQICGSPECRLEAHQEASFDPQREWGTY